MRAMISDKPGAPEKPRTARRAVEAGGQGRGARIGACRRRELPDTLIIADKYQFKPPRPFSPGHEVGGVVTELGEGVIDYAVGDRVIGMIGHGGYAEEAVIPTANLLPMPANMSFEEGAAFTMTYGTSYYALKQRGDLMPGETLLVLGAAGGVGLTRGRAGRVDGRQGDRCMSAPTRRWTSAASTARRCS